MDCCPHCHRNLSENPDVPHIDEAACTVSYRGVTVRLAAAEIDALAMLMASGKRGMSRYLLAANLYLDRSDNELPNMQIIAVYFSKIRRRFRAAGMPIDIVTNYGRGTRNAYRVTYGEVPRLRFAKEEARA